LIEDKNGCKISRDYHVLVIIIEANLYNFRLNTARLLRRRRIAKKGRLLKTVRYCL
jgi:hypothetical protein